MQNICQPLSPFMNPLKLVTSDLPCYLFFVLGHSYSLLHLLDFIGGRGKRKRIVFPLSFSHDFLVKHWGLRLHIMHIKDYIKRNALKCLS